MTENTTEPQSSPGPASAVGGSQRRKAGPLGLLLLLMVAIGLGYAIRNGLNTRVAADADLKLITEEAAVPLVNVVHPKTGAPSMEISLPGNTQAFVEAPIYARTSGYLKRWYFDIGAHVKKGALLAEIETPEVDQQLAQARADVETAKANLHLAETTAERWQVLLKSDSVSKQETDEKVSDLRAKKAIADSQASVVRRLEELQSFQKVYAPFDGIITVRNTDTGALIDAGANSAAKALFRLAAIEKLRVFVAVPEVFSRAAQPGSTASLALDEFPGRTFRGTLVRNANSIDPMTHTLLVEVDVENADGQLLPGAYVTVRLTLPRQIHSVTVPDNALLFRPAGMHVAVVREGKAFLTPVKIGRDYGTSVEILSGLGTKETVILDPADSLTNGTIVRAVEPPLAPPAAGGAKK